MVDGCLCYWAAWMCLVVGRRDGFSMGLVGLISFRVFLEFESNWNIDELKKLEYRRVNEADDMDIEFLHNNNHLHHIF